MATFAQSRVLGNMKTISLSSGETFKLQWSESVYAEIEQSSLDPNLVMIKLPNKYGNFGYIALNSTLNGTNVSNNESDLI